MTHEFSNWEYVPDFYMYVRNCYNCGGIEMKHKLSDEDCLR